MIILSTFDPKGLGTNSSWDSILFTFSRPFFITVIYSTARKSDSGILFGRKLHPTAVNAAGRCDHSELLNSLHFERRTRIAHSLELQVRQSGAERSRDRLQSSPFAHHTSRMYFFIAETNVWQWHSTVCLNASLTL